MLHRGNISQNESKQQQEEEQYNNFHSFLTVHLVLMFCLDRKQREFLGTWRRQNIYLLHSQLKENLYYLMQEHPTLEMVSVVSATQATSNLKRSFSIVLIMFS